ncbi:MAG: L-threonine 3-dehydrogenase [Acholeplasmataceae bacterium]|jgi:threonine 3-dehydrogenase
MMKVIVKNERKKGFEIGSKPIPDKLLPNEVLIKTISVSICGTDLHIYNWDVWSQNRVNPPITVGHEFSGQVVNIGSAVTKVKVGDVVSSESHIVCGKCEFCLAGKGHICEATKVIGVDTDGCFAEYVKVPQENLFIDTSGLDPLHLSVLEPLGNAVHAVRHFDVKDKDILIIGCGPIGLMGIDVALASGAKRVFASEVNPYRINLAKELGADFVINPTKDNPLEIIMKNTNYKGVDVIVDFSGNKGAVEDAFDYIKPGGGISILGVFTEKLNLDFNKIVFKGLNVYGVTGRMLPQTWNQIDELLKNHKLQFDKFVTHIFPFDEFEKGFKLMNEGKSGKVVLKL